jgi:RNA polymerase sigma factor for flagellar operon FliA
MAHRPENRDALIIRYLPMVRKVAYRMVSRFPSCVDVDDLVSIGMLGLIDAVDRFEHERSASFGAYARIRVQGAILDELRKNDWVPRSVRDRGDRIQTAREQLGRDLGRAPTELEVARTLGVTEERLREMVDDSLIRAVVSLEDGLDDDHSLGDLLASSDDTPHDELVRARMQVAIRASLATLTERERMIVDCYYYRDMNFKEIGEMLNVTESRVSQIHTRMKERLEEELALVATEAA